MSLVRKNPMKGGDDKIRTVQILDYESIREKIHILKIIWRAE
jgi:hypothetical protein